MYTGCADGSMKPASHSGSGGTLHGYARGGSGEPEPDGDGDAVTEDTDGASDSGDCAMDTRSAMLAKRSSTSKGPRMSSSVRMRGYTSDSYLSDTDSRHSNCAAIAQAWRQPRAAQRSGATRYTDSDDGYYEMQTRHRHRQTATCGSGPKTEGDSDAVRDIDSEALGTDLQHL